MITVENLTKIYASPIKTGNFLRDTFHKQYRHHTALDHVSFEIGENELVGFIGPNGAGKTTTMKILSGILYPSSGKVNIFGYTPFEKDKHFLKQIAFIMGQKNQLLWELPPTDSFTLNKAIYEIPEREYKHTLHELIELLDCKNFIHQPVKTLSLGQRMRVELIASLLHKPKVLFLDEPTIGLDIFAQTIIINFIKEYQEKYKATIILTSHYMQDIERLAKKVMLIDRGHIIFNGPFEELINTYSQNKIITIYLNKPLHDTEMLKGIHHTYTYPEMQVTLKKEDLPELLPKLLKHLDFGDVTIENEPIEEVIKKSFSSSQNIK